VSKPWKTSFIGLIWQKSNRSQFTLLQQKI
jgi:hypothetical protein